MEPLYNDHLINNASANGDGAPLYSLPDTDCTNLQTFDFETFLAASQDHLLIPGEYAALQDIDFAAEAQTSLYGASYAKFPAPEITGSPEPPPHTELPGPFTAVDNFSPPPLMNYKVPVPADPLLNVYMPSQQTGESDWQYIQPPQMEYDFDNVEQVTSPMQGLAVAAASSGEDVPAQQLSPPKRTSKSRRRSNIAGLDPSRFYKPLPRPPDSWCPSQSVDTQFRYNAQGELDPSCKFLRQQISEYLTYHPLHTLYGPAPSTKYSGLRLLIQTTPADSEKRYPTKLSSKCRFANCPVPNHTIRNGQFRVAFDEQSNSTEPLDPFHNAGYVHLYCLEKNFDFPRMCQHFNVQGDDREFLEGRNKMAITRDYPAMMGIVNNFIQTAVPSGGNRPENWYDHSLSIALTKYHLEHQCKQRQRVRDARNGNSLDRHLNNLDVMVEIAKSIQKRKAEEKESKKREAGDVELGDLTLDGKRTKFI